MKEEVQLFELLFSADGFNYFFFYVMTAEKLLPSTNYQNENKGRLKILNLLCQLNKKENNAEGNCLTGFKEHVNFISGLLHRL